MKYSTRVFPGIWLHDLLGDTAAFRTPEARDLFLDRAMRFCQYPAQGTALLHATSVSLGPFSSEEKLFEDCARIFTAEMRAYQVRLGYEPSVRVEEITTSTKFRRAYHAARDYGELSRLKRSTNWLDVANERIQVSKLLDEIIRVHERVYKELREV